MLDAPFISRLLILYSGGFAGSFLVLLFALYFFRVNSFDDSARIDSNRVIVNKIKQLQPSFVNFGEIWV